MFVDPSGHFFSMRSLTSAMSIMNTLNNVYTVASIGVDIVGGNYAGASKAIMEEVVSSKLGRIRAIGYLGKRGLAMFYKMFRKGRAPKLNLTSAHSSKVLRENLELLGFSGNGSAAHHIIGSGKAAEPANKILRRSGININSPSNGVFLPNTRIWRVSPATPHIGGHNGDYWKFVNGKLERAVSGKTPGTDEYKWAVINALSEIRLKLLTGQLTLNKHIPYN